MFLVAIWTFDSLPNNLIIVGFVKVAIREQRPPVVAEVHEDTSQLKNRVWWWV